MKLHGDLQIVWPKDGEKGRSKRGFFGGLGDILSGKGPDMFLQKEGRREAIAVDRWGNWDTLHHKPAHYYENVKPRSRLLGKRDRLRYDPYSREYVEWDHTDDWSNQGINPARGNIHTVPRYTEDERRKIYPRWARNKSPDPFKMGDDWSNIGPKRWRPEYDWFWSNAHRIGTSKFNGLDPQSSTWARRWGQVSRSDLHQYTQDEF